jgi:hypothetical protein
MNPPGAVANGEARHDAPLFRSTITTPPVSSET